MNNKFASESFYHLQGFTERITNDGLIGQKITHLGHLPFKLVNLELKLSPQPLSPAYCQTFIHRSLPTPGSN